MSGHSPDMQGGDSASIDSADERLQLQTRIAWMYYVENETQDAIARRLGINRMRVNRLLTASRDAGVVRIEIAWPFRACVALEARLQERFGIRRAVVVPTPQSVVEPVDAVGVALGRYLGERLADDLTIGVQPGRTCYALFNGLPAVKARGVKVVSLVGGLTPSSQIVVHEVAPRLALHLSADCFYLAAPTFVRDPQERERLLALETVRSALARAQTADLAIITASRAETAGGLVGYGFVSAVEMRELLALGAVGAVLGTFVDAKGAPVDHPLNHARIGLPLDQLARIPDVVLVGSGPGKVPGFLAILRAGWVSTLVTDEDTASLMLRDA